MPRTWFQSSPKPCACSASATPSSSTAARGRTAARGLDELSISGPTQLAEVYGNAVSFDTLTPEQVGLTTAPIESLRGGDAAANAGILRAIFAGEPGPRRDVVLLNAAAVLITAGAVPASPNLRHEAFRAAIVLAARTMTPAPSTGARCLP